MNIPQDSPDENPLFSEDDPAGLSPAPAKGNGSDGSAPPATSYTAFHELGIHGYAPNVTIDQAPSDPLGELKALDRWVLWKWENKKNGKLTKPPYQGRSPDNKAKNNDPKTWCDYATAIANVGKAAGIGFCLFDSNYAAFDLDDCRDPETGTVHPWAADLARRANSYAEITPSGTGLRIIGIGNGPEVHRKLEAYDGMTVEPYRKATRYITVTGNQLQGTPSRFSNIDALIDSVVAELDAKKAAASGEPTGDDTGADRVSFTDDELFKLIKNGCSGTEYADHRSRGVFFVACEMLRRGYLPSTVVATLLDRKNKITEHVYDQADPERCALRMVDGAIQKLDFTRDDEGRPHKTQNNVRVSLVKMGITLRHDQFSDTVLIDGLEGFGPILDDAALDRIWLLMDRYFRLMPSRTGFLNVVIDDTARINSFHPVRDYLAGLRWDGKKRIDKWLVTYGGAEDTEYTGAVGKLFMVGAVRRVRQPGCKFDEMLVLENPEQGNNKSSALALLAVKDEWFSDDLPLNADTKKVIEATRGIWIMEASELSGMKRADVDHLKSFLSRQSDRSRMAYDRLITVRKRQFVVAGTTNSRNYLRDQSGNRRFWPVFIKKFDLDSLRRDRDQLWAEAAAAEATGTSIRLEPRLWPVAAEQQLERTPDDPWKEALEKELGDLKGKISKECVWTILNVPTHWRGQEQAARLNQAMEKIGWVKPNSQWKVKIGDKMIPGFVKGEKPWKIVRANRDEHGVIHMSSADDKEEADKKDADKETEKGITERWTTERRKRFNTEDDEPM